MAIILFCLGAVGVARSIYNKMTGKEWGNQAFGSLLSFAFGTIVAVFWQLAQGRAVGLIRTSRRKPYEKTCNTT
ncbi:MAG: hypothetical protein IPQ00_17440 [Chloracidobacterium sp.]|nr:hypothetical protein [Chloracidobacterium sp.]